MWCASLLGAGADPVGPRPWGRFNVPIWTAVRLGRTDLVDLMLTDEVAARLEPESPDMVHAAAEAGDPELLARMLALPNRRGTLAGAFMVALRDNSEALVEVLLRSGGPSAPRELLPAAAQAGNLAMMKRALSLGADPNAPLHSPPALAFVLSGQHENDEELLEVLLDAGADVEHPLQHPRYRGVPVPPLLFAVTSTYREPINDDEGVRQAAVQQRLVQRLLKLAPGQTRSWLGSRP
jgi:hypothetical protein